MDRSSFRKYFGDLPPSGVAAYLRAGADPERVRTEMLDALDEGHRAFIYSNRTLRNEILNVFDSTFAITYALELIATAGVDIQSRTNMAVPPSLFEAE